MVSSVVGAVSKCCIYNTVNHPWWMSMFFFPSTGFSCGLVWLFVTLKKVEPAQEKWFSKTSLIIFILMVISHVHFLAVMTSLMCTSNAAVIKILSMKLSSKLRMIYQWVAIQLDESL